MKAPRVTRLLATVLWMGAVLQARDPTPQVVALNVKDSINPFTTLYIQRGIKEAETLGAALCVIHLDTPGGLMDSMRDIVQMILNAEVPVAVYVYPPGSNAGSAGAFITLAADIAAMTRGTTIGSAHPVALPTGGGQPEGEGDTMMKKVTENAAAFIRSIAEERGRNADLAQRMVTESISLSETEAHREKIVDYVARDTADLLAQLNGKTIKKGDKEFKFDGLDRANVVNLPMSVYERVFSRISHPGILYILFLAGISALLYGVAHPDQVYPLVIGLILVVMAVVAAQSLPIHYGAVALIVIGIALIIAEIKVAGYGALGALGVAAFLIGSFMFGATPEFRVPTWIVIAVGGPLLFMLGLAVYLIAQTFKRPPFVGSIEAIRGHRAKVVKDLAPEGLVELDGEIWRARCRVPLKAGATVRVASKDGMVLQVTQEPSEVTSASSKEG
jgi:membrane-bound serine protease (ClpP class)